MAGFLLVLTQAGIAPDGSVQPAGTAVMRVPTADAPAGGGRQVIADDGRPVYGEAAKLAEQRYATAISAGLAITSTGTPALNGTYSVSDSSRADLTAIQTGINAGAGFPGGASTFPWRDMTGVPHTMTPAQFLAVATAIRDYVAGVKLAAAAAAAGQAATWPAATATIP